MRSWNWILAACLLGGALIGCGGVPDDEDVETRVITDEELPANVDGGTLNGQPQ